MAINIETLQAQTSTVTPEQIGRCHKIFDSHNKAFWLVENEAGNLDEHGDLIEYRVDLDGPYCSCRAGQFAFVNCKNGCKYVLWALAAEAELTEALAALTATAPQPATPQRAHHLVCNGQVASDAEYARIMGAQPKPSAKKAPLNRQAGFSLLR